MPSSNASALTFSVIVPTYRRPGALHDTLLALASVDYPGNRYEVIVVDDGADPATGEVAHELRSAAFQPCLLEQPGLGVATARNRGAQRAKGEFLLFCDDDIIVEPDHFELHEKLQRSHRDWIVNAVREFSPSTLRSLAQAPFGRYRLDAERRFREGEKRRRLGDRQLEIDVLPAYNFSIRRELFSDLRGFDQSFPHAGAEDQDFSIRARRAGCRLVRDERIRVLHNDIHMTFRQFCEHEERGAQTYAVLATKYPDVAGRSEFATANSRPSRSDPPRLFLRKLAKRALSRSLILSALHGVVQLLERSALSERILRRVYSLVIGVHISKGFRATASSQA